MAPDTETKSGTLFCPWLKFQLSTPDERQALNPLRFALGFSTVVALTATLIDVVVLIVLDGFGFIANLKNALLVGIVVCLSISFSISFLLAYSNAKQVKSLSRSHEHYKYLSHTDGLTGLRNRAGLQAESKRLGRQYSLAFFDIDHFKSINDNYGHAAGDAVISGIAQRITKAFPASSLVSRLGGEEFVVAVSDVQLQAFTALCEDCRTAVQEQAFVADGVAINVTVSIGVSTPSEGEEFDKVMHRADVALYKAKASGRNRVVIDDSGEAEERLTA